MNDEQRKARLTRLENYRSSTYRRWRVYSTFLTGFLIGLLYVIIISEWNEGPQFFGELLDQRTLILMFSGIMGGVIYTILVDGHVEMPRFVANKGDQFEAGLFGDILLGIAGAIVLDFLTQQTTLEVAGNIQVAALGIIGGYGGRAILQFALNRMFSDINVLEEDRQKYLKVAYQQKMEAMDGLKVIDQLNTHIQTGLTNSELAELTAAIRQAPTTVRKQVFDLAKDFRRTANLSDVTKHRIERTIPIFEALIDSEPDSHQFYAEAAFAYKDSGLPDLFKAIQYLDKAIETRGDRYQADTWKYELCRAITRIQQAYQIQNSYNFDAATNEHIIKDLLAVAKIYNLENILKAAKEKDIPVPVIDWARDNEATLRSHDDMRSLLLKLDQLEESETAQRNSSEANQQAIHADKHLEKNPANISNSELKSPQSRVDSASQQLAQTSPIKVPQTSKPTSKTATKLAADFIKEFEGYHKELSGGRAEAYEDPIKGWSLPTIGYGTTKYADGRQVKRGDIISREEAEKSLVWMIESECKPVLSKISTWPRMNENQQAALYSFAYNLGKHFYRGENFESITRVCDSPEKWSNQAWIEEQFIKYRNPGSSAEEGLRKRRLAESKLFCQPTSVTHNLAEASSHDKPLFNIYKEQLSLVPELINDNKELAKHIQEVLIWIRLLDPPADGKFGPLSASALLRFQETMIKQVPKIADEKGFLGPWTAKALIETSPDLFPRPTLQIGNDLASRIIKYMKFEGYLIFSDPKEYNIVYIEGMNPDGTLNDNKPNCFNDVRLVIEFKDSKPVIIGKWGATTEPGSRYTMQGITDVARKYGAARIKFGQYKAWTVGIHGNADKHEALVQSGKISIYRDLNKDFLRSSDKIYEGDEFCINQHWGYDAPSNDIKTASAGCLVGRTRDGHKEFMAIIKQDRRYQANKNYMFYTTIISGSDLAHEFPA